MSLSVTAKKAANVPKEKFGKSDPYCQISYQGQKLKTKIIKDSTDPEWNETLNFDLAGKPLGTTDSIDVALKDWERIGSDKLLGKCTVAARDLISSGELELSLTLSDKNGRPTQTTVDLKLQYAAPANQAAAGGGAGASGESADVGGGGEGDEGDEDDEDLDEGDLGITDGPDAAGPGGVAAAKKRRRERRKRRAKLSTKPTDFQVRVKVVEARQLAGANIHPITKLTLFGETKQTRVKKATNSPFFNEVFYYSSNISPAEIVDETILFEIFNSKRLRSDALIGAFKCDLGLIYDKPKHTVMNKWLLLNDSEDQAGVRGYLKVCVAVLGPGDEAPSFKSKPGDDETDDIESNMLMPAGLVLAPATFSVKVYQAEDLPRMDSAMLEGVKKFFSIGKKKPKELVDPYMIVSFAGKSVQSKILYETYSPEFNQEMKLGFKFPSVADNITLRLFDWDRITQHDVISSGFISQSLTSRSGDDGFLPTFGPCFVNFYGSTREFCEIGDDHEHLNYGKGDGIAYRGRVLVELSTELDTLPEAPLLDIEPEQVESVSKYMRRHRYMLHVSFLEASMIADTDAPVEFEVSIGSYGNKLDDTVMPSASCTQPTNAVFDGNKYSFLPWENKKPCIVVESFWEDISFRLDTINMFTSVADLMEERFHKVGVAQKANIEAIEIKTMLWSLMDELDNLFRRPLPVPGKGQLSNELDKFKRMSREAELAGLIEDLQALRVRDPENGELLTELQTVCETVKSLALEPQNSIPDVFIWMLCGNKRKAYFRLPVHEILYSPDGYNGKNCSRDMTIILCHPGKKANREWEIPAKLRVKFWMGKKMYEDQWHQTQTEEIAVVAETYENQAALLGKWITKGPAMTRPTWSDSTGNIKLKKKGFEPPEGWRWDGDWVVSPELSLLYDRDAGHKTFVEDVFELHNRLPGGPWSIGKLFWTDAKNDTMPSKEEIELPEGWKWDNDWTVDLNRGVDDEGFEYCVESTIGGFGPVEKTYHLARRRRWIRQRTMVADPRTLQEKSKKKMDASEGWEYAPLFNMKFHAKESKMDLVRRRRWHRKMIPSGPDVKPCFFSFQGEDSSDEEDEEAQRAACLAAPRMFLESSEKHTYQLRAYVYQARSLPAADDNAMSDPYASICFSTQSQNTQTMKKTLSPTWDQTLIFDEITLFGQPEEIAKNPPEVVVECFDKDTIGKDEFLGRATCKPMVKLTMSDTRTCVLQWHTLTNLKGEAGELLASFELLMANQSASLMDLSDETAQTQTSQLMNGEDLPFAPPKKGDLYIVPTGIRPIMQRTAIEILCWGVRNMKRYQLISITSPSIEFEIGGTVAQSAIIKNTKKNPNFSEALLFVDTMLPKEEYFMPPVNLRVRDHRAFGRKPTVGMHVIRSLDKYILRPKMDANVVEGPNDVQVQLVDDGQQPLVQGDTIVEIPPVAGDKPVQPPEIEDIDWWCKYYASIGEEDKCQKYMQLGFDTLSVYDTELEKAPEFNGFADFCDTFPIMHGDAMDEGDQEVIGEFKGSFKVYPLPEDPSEELPARLMDNLPSPAPEECVVRVYVVQAMDLQPADPNGLADPYLEVSLGKNKISLRDSYMPNTLNPVFGELLEFKCTMPLHKDLKITIRDYDLLSSDDIIGETIIDLENRFLSKYRATAGIPRTYYTSGPNLWRDALTPRQILANFCTRNRLADPAYSGNTAVRVGQRTYTLAEFENNRQPSVYWGAPGERLACYVLNCLPLVKEHVETRTLRNKLQPTFDQGKLQCWVDIFPKSMGPPGPPIDISPRKAKKYVLRVVIWNTTDVILDEANLLGEQMSDIYVKGWLPSGEKQKTDIHYRSLDGDGNFNWRMVYPFEYLPAEEVLVNRKKEHFWSLDETELRVKPKFTVQIWDNDFISADDFLGSLEVDMNCIPKPAKTSRACKLTQLPIFNKNAKTVSLFEQKKLNGFWPVYSLEGETPQLTGKVEMEMEILTEKDAEERPAANGREEPNMHPKLEEPNRPATSFFWLSNPFKSCKHIIWKRYKWWIIGGIILLLLIALIIIFLYTFPDNIWPVIFGRTTSSK